MTISRDADGLRFVGECSPEKGFIAGDIQCVRCGRRIDFEAREIALACLACGFKARSFWSEVDLHVYLAEQWGHLRKACLHPAVTTMRSS